MISQRLCCNKTYSRFSKNISGSEEEKLRRIYPILSNGRFFSIDCKENYELIRELTSFGKELIVLSPKLIQEKIINRIDDLKKYTLISNYEHSFRITLLLLHCQRKRHEVSNKNLQ